MKTFFGAKIGFQRWKCRQAELYGNPIEIIIARHPEIQ